MKPEGRLLDVLREMRSDLRDVQSKLNSLSRPLPILCTYERAAEELSVSKSQVKAMVRSGQLAKAMVGKRPRIPSTEIRRLAEGATMPRMPRPRRVIRAYDARAEAQAGREALKAEQAAERRERRS